MRRIFNAIGSGFAVLSLFTVLTGTAYADRDRDDDDDDENTENAVVLIKNGQRTFRFDTFGDEDFWGGALRLHEAIAGEANGGVGPGVSPALALALGLKVDVEALPRSLRKKIKRGKVDLDDPATTLALLKLNAVVGVKGFFDADGQMESFGIQCALCHSQVDDSLAPGIGHRLDGWANRDLNVGAIIAAAPDLGAREIRCGTTAGWQGFSARRPVGGNIDSTRFRPCRRQSPYLDRLGIGRPLECAGRCFGDGWKRQVVRSAPERCQ